jgi:hypothetical protein
MSDAHASGKPAYREQPSANDLARPPVSRARWRNRRADRSATPPGQPELARTPCKATSTTNSARTCAAQVRKPDARLASAGVAPSGQAAVSAETTRCLPRLVPSGSQQTATGLQLGERGARSNRQRTRRRAAATADRYTSAPRCSDDPFRVCARTQRASARRRSAIRICPASHPSERSDSPSTRRPRSLPGLGGSGREPAVEITWRKGQSVGA